MPLISLEYLYIYQIGARSVELIPKNTITHELTMPQKIGFLGLAAALMVITDQYFIEFIVLKIKHLIFR